ncbi:MAG TPA: DNA ligase D [Pirellulales bacterium]|nr:DNA ligase D [Pirellulales bacterium]
MSLTEYRRKRRFDETPEPAGKPRRKGTTPKTQALRLVVQKHDARRLHYDFRLELDGVLKSWAVPKGPSYDPREKRLAVEVEDHPLEYADFEGTIPEGEYGAGAVAVWDEGTWHPEGDPHQGYREGKLKFQLDGRKLKGRWTLVRMQHRPGERATNWLLIKERDELARPLEEYDVTAAEPNSVVSGRTLEEIASDNDRVWHTNRGAGATKKNAQKKSAGGQKTTSPPRGKRRRDGKLPGKSAAMPKATRLQFASLAKSPPDGLQWLHEIKFDGYRILCRVEKGKTQLITRGDQDWTDRMPRIAAAAPRLPVERAILDGEVVALEPSGVSSFQRLQNAFNERRANELIYFAFDVLYLDGHDLRDVPLEQRKEILADLLDHNSSVGPIRYTEHVDGHGKQCFIESCRMGLEGIISKRRDRPYVGGRSYDWLKSKCVRREEFVIGGFTEPEGGRQGLGALLIGSHDASGKLKYAGKVGTGFTDKTLVDLRKRLEQLEQRESPFSDLRVRPRKTHWVEPELVCQVEFSSWTDDGRLRHPSFQGLREDKPAESVRREEPQEFDGKAMKSTGRTKGRPATRAARQRPTKSKSKERQAEELDPGTVAGVRLTNPGRILYPERGVTKLALASFYVRIADWMLPHVAGRPLSLLRCPEGRHHTCFFQKHLGPGAPDVLERVQILEKGKPAEYAALHDVAGLVALVQMGILEIHVWGCRADDVERPDRLVFDLDPAPDADWDAVVQAAYRVRDALGAFDLESFVKTTGGKGLHVVAPIQRRHEWSEVKAFSKSLAEQIARESPELYTINPLKARRVGKVFIDYLRNERGATAVAAYSTRAREGAPVSVPVEWRELGRLTGGHFTVENLPARLARLKHDPWAELSTLRQSITSAAIKAVTRR